MPLIKPFLNNPTSNTNDVSIPEGLEDILIASGLQKPKQDFNDIRRTFDSHGAGIEEIAEQVAHIIARGESDAARLKACEIAAKVQGIMVDLEGKVTSEIKINIICSLSQNIVNLVCPSES